MNMNQSSHDGGYGIFEMIA